MLQNVTAEEMEQSESILPIFAVHLRRFDLKFFNRPIRLPFNYRKLTKRTVEKN